MSSKPDTIEQQAPVKGGASLETGIPNLPQVISEAGSGGVDFSNLSKIAETISLEDDIEKANSDFKSRQQKVLQNLANINYQAYIAKRIEKIARGDVPPRRDCIHSGSGRVITCELDRGNHVLMDDKSPDAQALIKFVEGIPGIQSAFFDNNHYSKREDKSCARPVFYFHFDDFALGLEELPPKPEEPPTMGWGEFLVRRMVSSSNTTEPAVEAQQEIDSRAESRKELLEEFTDAASKIKQATPLIAGLDVQKELKEFGSFMGEIEELLDIKNIDNDVSLYKLKQGRRLLDNVVFDFETQAEIKTNNPTDVAELEDVFQRTIVELNDLTAEAEQPLHDAARTHRSIALAQLRDAEAYKAYKNS